MLDRKSHRPGHRGYIPSRCVFTLGRSERSVRNSRVPVLGPECGEEPQRVIGVISVKSVGFEAVGFLRRAARADIEQRSFGWEAEGEPVVHTREERG